MPADELGEIMRSRNESILKLRRQETALADALSRLEQVANDLKRKNHLLEAARRNLADADRLASLGMMSAGLAHELNTPLTVLKGLVEKLNADPGQGLPAAEAALMLRVVGRLERLGESLLDFARVRPPPDRTTARALAPLNNIFHGRITIDAETSTKDAHDWVSLTITDTGPGINPDLLSTVFEPFVSTRLDSRGTGLGLAVAEGIVREHG